MGFAISWLAATDKNARRIFEELKLSPTGERAEIPEGEISSAQLPGGWTLIFANCFDSPLVSDKALGLLSMGCTVVSCQVEEHVMFSSANCFSNGQEQWRVSHDAQENIYQLSTNGRLPPEFDSIYASLKKSQDEAGGEDADVDYIHDVPIAIAKSVTAFRHDENIPGAEAEPFEVLARSSSESTEKPWWRVW